MVNESGILSYSAYLPRRRMRRKSIAAITIVGRYGA
jgi:hypothetical protein